VNAVRLITWEDALGACPALLVDDELVVDIPGGVDHEADGLLRIIEHWGSWEPIIRGAAGDAEHASRVAVTSGRILAPLRPGTLLLAGANDSDHTREMTAATSTTVGAGFTAPYLFALPTRHTIVGTGAEVRVPAWAQKIDWEVELAVVIGRTARDVAAEDAMDYVFGFTILNNITSREANRRLDGPFKNDWFSGKGNDTFCPLGPAIVPKDDFTFPATLQLTVNGTTMQNGSTDDLTFDVPSLVAYASTRTTLEPGDVISTGTPAGVGAGRGIFLNDGDAVVATIPGIGSLANTIRMLVAAPVGA
jgi:2,4-didehydro-3-deoxy-L-rhamnonate hydrolase